MSTPCVTHMAAPTTSGTARGVAKARDIESMLPPELRLVDDPYAAAMAGWRTPRWLLRCSGHGLRQAISDALTCPGYVQLMVARTRLFDDEVVRACAPTAPGEARTPCTQLLILGAGFCTRGSRLPIPPHVRVYEVDQPSVQAAKRRLMAEAQRAARKSERAASASGRIVYLPLDLSEAALDAALRAHPGYDPAAPTVVTVEGLTQYMPAEAVAATLEALGRATGPGSRLVASYVDARVHTDPAAACGEGYPAHALARVAAFAERANEPWLSSWPPPPPGGRAAMGPFGRLLAAHGRWRAERDESAGEANEAFFAPIGRRIPPSSLCMMERFVVAAKGDSGGGGFGLDGGDTTE